MVDDECGSCGEDIAPEVSYDLTTFPPKVVIEVEGGLVQNVFTDMPMMDVMVYDRDNINAGDDPPTEYDYPTHPLTDFER